MAQVSRVHLKSLERNAVEAMEKIEFDFWQHYRRNGGSCVRRIFYPRTSAGFSAVQRTAKEIVRAVRSRFCCVT